MSLCETRYKTIRDFYKLPRNGVLCLRFLSLPQILLTLVLFPVVLKSESFFVCNGCSSTSHLCSPVKPLGDNPVVTRYLCQISLFNEQFLGSKQVFQSWWTAGSRRLDGSGRTRQRRGHSDGATAQQGLFSAVTNSEESAGKRSVMRRPGNVSAGSIVQFRSDGAFTDLSCRVSGADAARVVPGDGAPGVASDLHGAGDRGAGPPHSVQDQQVSLPVHLRRHAQTDARRHGTCSKACIAVPDNKDMMHSDCVTVGEPHWG